MIQRKFYVFYHNKYLYWSLAESPRQTLDFIVETYDSIRYPIDEGILSNKAILKEDAETQISLHCNNELPDSHWPDEYVFVDGFPTTRVGKS